MLEEQAVTRAPELVPIRYGRMLSSAFAFYRGGALIMATDLSRTPNSGIRTQLCGDAHLSNFGTFGSPERTLVFDINDFDETAPGPWEWDVKRLAASFAIAGRDNGFSQKHREAAVLATARSYREAMTGFAAMRNLQVWYASLPMEQALREFTAGVDPKRLKKAEADLAKARTRDSMHAYEKLTHLVDGEPRIISDPPLIVPIVELLPPGESRDQIESEIRDLFRAYRGTLASDRRVLLEQFRYVDLARKVVGVGSVGTRDRIALFLGVDGQDPLFLQVKEAQPSVLERFVGKSEYPNHGQRVVAGQRLMQAATDIFIGWQRSRPARRAGTGLLRAPTEGLEGLTGDRGDGPARPGRVREGLRLDARARPRTLGRPDRDQRVPRQVGCLRPGDGLVRRDVRRPERAGLRGAPGRRRLGPGEGRDGSLTGATSASDPGCVKTLKTAAVTQ